MYTRIPRGTHPEIKKPLNEICEREKWIGERVAEEEEGVWMWLASGGRSSGDIGTVRAQMA